VDEGRLLRRAKRISSALGYDDAEISLWICDDETIRGLHDQYFGLDTPTNVISFSQREGEFDEVEPDLLGDVVVSFETAARDSVEAGHSVEDEITFLFIHGFLHLIGFDHEGERLCDAPEMEAKEEELFKLVREMD